MTDFSLNLSRPVCIGIIGGGQLGKMLAQEAHRLSFKTIILDPTEDCPAFKIADEQILANFKDEEAILRLAQKCDVLTYEIELANSATLKLLQECKHPVWPAPETLHIIQNKYRQKSFLKKNGIAVPKFALVESEEQLLALCEQFGYPAVLKATEDSYDGRGNYIIKSKPEIKNAYHYFGRREIMLEKFVPFAHEVSIMTARNPSGQIESFPVAENVHKEGILDMTIVPARVSQLAATKAKKMAEKAMQVLNGAGMFGIEMFVTKRGDVLINEIAPRVHNSGHYTIEACPISQFEQHLRAILDLPLSKPELLSPACMINILGPENFDGLYVVEGTKSAMEVPGAVIHIYGKHSSKPRRKLGHVTATGRTANIAILRAKKARKAIRVVPL